jgi:hypothetical protein
MAISKTRVTHDHGSDMHHCFKGDTLKFFKCRLTALVRPLTLPAIIPMALLIPG